MNKMKLLPIGKVCHVLEVDRETVKRWEKQGRIKTYRNAWNYRLIPEDQVNQIKAARQNQAK